MNRSEITEQFRNPPKFFTMVLDAFEAGVMFIDTEYTILFLNKEKRDKNPHIQPGMKCYEMFEEYGIRCPFCVAYTAMEEGEPQVNEDYVSIKKGVEVPVHLRISAFPVYDESNELLGAIEIAYDVETLYQTNIRLERLNKEYEHMIYALSHDLRSPLVSIEGFLTKLTRGNHLKENDSVADHCIHRMHVNVGMMNNLVKVLLDTSRIATGKLEIQEVDIQFIINNLVEQFSGKIRDTGASVQMNLETTTCICDRTRAQQVFANLIENCLSHCRGTENLTIEVGSKGSLFWVRDNGPGIPEQFKEKVFEAFTQAAEGGHDHFGMGMNIVYRIINKHGGKIWIESSQGTGTTVFFSFSPS